MNEDSTAGPFTRRAVVILLTVGIVGAISFLLLSAYAPDLRSGNDGGGHAISVAATGFKGLYDLNTAYDGTSTLLRSDDVTAMRELLMLTPPVGTSSREITRRLERRATAAIAAGDAASLYPTLIILPKWDTAPDPAHPGWVIGLKTLPPAVIAALLPPSLKAQIRQPRRTAPQRARLAGRPGGTFDLPAIGQTIAGPGLVPLIADPAGGALLARIPDRAVYILADPDILDNQGLKREGNARAALAMLDAISPSTTGQLTFDVTLNGFGRSPSLLKLAFEPPFVAVTLCLLAAGFLAGIQALVRFGPPRHEARAMAFGKAALLDNSADIIRRARREARSGERYLVLTREAIATATGAPIDRADAYLDRLEGSNGHRWTDLADQARQAKTTEAVVATAHALYAFRKDVTRERG